MTTQDQSGTHATLADSGDNANSQELPRGSNLGRYVIIEPIGSGGMGTVYRAYDPQLNRGVALKILSVKQEDQQAAERAKARLIREAQALAQLSHPNVVAVHDAGTFEDDVFIAMELVEGKTLDEWMKEEKRPIKEILEVTIAAGRGLSAAHKAGLIHRDFKPGNVIVGDDGRVRVLDFGLARAAEQKESKEETTVSAQDGQSQELTSPFGPKKISSESSPNLLQSPLTHMGGVLGTPMYMAPEQHLGLKTDERTDQFGFCVVLYEALYGKRPFAARSIRKLKDAVIRQQVLVPRPGTDVPGWLWRIVLKGLNAEPEDRYPNMDSLLQELDRDLEEERRQKQLARRRKLLVVSLIIIAVALPIGVWYGLRYRTVQLCKDAEGEFVGVWDEKTKVSIENALLSTGKSFAQGTWERVETAFDSYLDKWKQMRSDICEAKVLRATLSEELFDLKMNCLQKRKREFKALLKVFAKADEQVVQKAVQASTSLAGVSTCSDEAALRAPYPPPKTAEGRVKAATIREKLTEVEAFRKTGKYRVGLALANKLTKELEAFAYPPVKAEVLSQLGELLYYTGEYKLAESTLYEAERAGGVSQNIGIVVGAMSLRLFIVSHSLDRPDDALLIGREAEVIVELAGTDYSLRARLFNNLGSIFWGLGDHDNAMAYFTKALETWKEALGPEHLNLAMPLNNIGAVFNDVQAEYDKALECHRKALSIRKKVLGPKHPDVAQSLHNIGGVFAKQGSYDKALEYYNQALTIRKQALGPKHPLVASTLNDLGHLFLERNEYDNALRYHREALAILEKVLRSEHPLVASTLRDIGLVFVAQGKIDKALKQLRKSLAVMKKVKGAEHPSVTSFLIDIGTVHLEQGLPAKALVPLERVMRICENRTCEASTHGLGLFALARSLLATGGDKQRVIKLATQAREIFSKTPKRFKKNLEEVNSWLQEHEAKKQPKKAPK